MDVKKPRILTPEVSRAELPVLAHRAEFKQKCLENEVILVVGETGSGKTTKLPQFLLDELKVKKVTVTQPRRVAATTLARRVAYERKGELGKEVGYRVRFDDVTSEDTRLIFCTDGLLLREAMHDPYLKQYDWIVLDEAHERSLNTDVLFGVVKRALKMRNSSFSITSKNKKLGLVVMSATLDISLFQTFFERSSLIQISGRQYPVDVWYLPQAMDDRVDACVRTAAQIHEDEPLLMDGGGDILIFLSGKEEIDTCCRALNKLEKKLIICPLHGSLPAKVQMKAFEKTKMGYRKIVVATNVAETSVTVDGVRFVIDAGVVKVKRRLKSSGLKRLSVVPISKSQAWQRCGRAGREGIGKCYRLYTEAQFESMKEDSEPEILRIDLSEVVMQLLALGVSDISSFDFLQRPEPGALREALNELSSLGAIKIVDNKLALTDRGKKMSSLPVEPVHASLLLKSIELDCLKEIAGIVAMGCGIELPFYGNSNQAKKLWINPTGDHLTSLNILDAYSSEFEKGNQKNFAQDQQLRIEILQQAHLARLQLIEICMKFVENPSILTSQGADNDTVLRCVATGVGTKIAKRIGRSEYQPLFLAGKSKENTFLHPSSTLSSLGLRPEYVVFDEILVTSKTYIRGVSEIKDVTWIAREQPQLFKSISTNEQEKQQAIEKERKQKKAQRAFAVDCS